MDLLEIEKAFRELREDKISEKAYVFFRSSRLAIRGDVGIHEPETIQLTIDGSKKDIASFERVITESEFQFSRIGRFENEHGY